MFSDDSEISSVRNTLLKHYGDQQRSQGTRLIGFVAGLFALWTLTSDVLRLSQVFEFPYIPWLTDWVLSLEPWLVDFSKIAFLFLGTSVILYFILRAIFRYSFYGHMVNAVIYIPKEEIEKLLKEEKHARNLRMNNLYSLHLATTFYVYSCKKIFRLPARWFFSLGSIGKAYPNKEIIGNCFLGLLAGFFSLLLLLFMW